MNLKTLTVADLMTTALITIKGSESVRLADVDMRLAAIRHIPVVDERYRLIGIVSNRDLYRVLAKEGGGEIPVRKVMSTNLYTIHQDAPAHEAVEQMIEKKISALPVIGDDEQLVGIVTATDFLQIAHDALLTA